ncbi:MAG: hypothetical protein HOP08_13115 [Cyclobacteriaceae bacterium]|nr:hypothetical protein [Cyclobacteriaceae bacterium]
MLIESQWSKTLLITFLGFVSFLTLSAQVLLEGRIEIPINEDSNAEKFKAIGIEKNGLIIYRIIPGREEDKLELIKVDTSFIEGWRGYIGVPRNLTLIHAEYSNGILFILFKHRFYLGGDFQIISVRVNDGKFSTYLVKNLIPFNPTQFTINSQAAMIGGYFNYRPLVLYYNFTLQTSKILPGFLNEEGELDQLKPYSDGSVDVVVCARNLQKKKSLWIRNYDSQGELIKTTIVQPDVDKNYQLLFGRSVRLSNGDQIVAGVYGRFSDLSRGIFVAGINPVGEYSIRYYNFSELDNFFSYMKVRRQKRIKERIERRKIHGKKIKFNYRFLIHEIIPYKDQYIMTGEAFYPHYAYPNNSNLQTRSFYQTAASGFYNSPNMRGEMVFDGYQYTHAVVVGFDKTGSIQWDNSFEINDVKTMQLEQFVEVKPEKDRIVMMYLFKNKLRTKIINDSQVLEGKSQDDIKTNPNQKIDPKSIVGEQLDYWYGEHFYAYGIQIVSTGGSERKIFYVNKLTYK